MTTQNEIIEKLDLTADQTVKVKEAYEDVLKTEGEQDITLYDGTTTPNLNKRLAGIVQAVKSVNGKDGEIVLSREDLGIPSDEQLARQEKEDRFVITWSGRTQKQKNKEMVSPEDFGDTTGDATEAFRAMLASDCNVYKPDPQKTYLITKQLDFGEQSFWMTDLNILLKGSPSISGSYYSGRWGNNTASQQCALVCEGLHIMQDINIHQDTSHLTASQLPWTQFIGNDYYLRKGERPTKPHKFEAKNVTLTADRYLGDEGNLGAHGGVFRFSSIKEVWVDSLNVNNSRRAIICRDIDDLRINEILDVKNSKGGGDITISNKAKIGEIYFYNDENHPAIKDMAGNNAIMCAGVRDLTIGNVTTYRAGEHGVRICSMAAQYPDNPAYTGNFVVDILTSATIGDVQSYKSGACGFKASSAVLSDNTIKPISYLYVNSIYAEDSAYVFYKDESTLPITTPENHFGINLQNILVFSSNKIIVKKKDNLASGYRGFLLRSCNDFHVNEAVIEDTAAVGIHLEFNSQWEHKRFHIGDLTIRRTGVYVQSDAALRFLNAGLAGDFYIKGRVYNSAQLVFATHTASPKKPFILDIDCRGVTDTTSLGTLLPSDFVQCNIRKLEALTSGSTLYPDGTIIMARAYDTTSSIPVRASTTSSVDVYLAPRNSHSYVWAVSGTPVTDVGAKLEGVWRHFGSHDDKTLILQKYSN